MWFVFANVFGYTARIMRDDRDASLSEALAATKSTYRSQTAHGGV